MKASVHYPFNLHLSEGECFYANKRHAHVGPPPEISFPQPLRSWIARLLYGTWSLYRIRACGTPVAAEYRASEGHRFVKIELGVGETVCFHHHNLVGFSGGVILSTAVSLQIPAICLGRAFFHLAKGPGFLVLESHGEPQIIEDTNTDGALPPSRLLCWSKNTEFSLIGSVKGSQILLDSPLFFHLERNELVVIDSIHSSQRIKNSVFGRFKKIYFPWL